MKVTGFSFIKNAVKFQYPIAEALQSILPLCDEVVVAVGKSDDGTRELIASLHPSKILIIDTEWDTSLKEGGRVLAAETDKAFKAIAPDTDWCIYIQGDEVLHEDGYDNICEAMLKWCDHPEVDGLLFKYRHFFGSYDFVGIESHWYRYEVRIIRNNKGIYSYRDAQGFRKDNNEKLRVKPVNAYIHHYGWVQDPRIMKAKNDNKGVIYNGKEEQDVPAAVPEDYAFSMVNALQKFTDTHPKVMQRRIAQANWVFNYDVSKNKLRLKDKFKFLIEKIMGELPFQYRNYKII